MTLNFAPWAIDGARSTSALARLATYATGGGRSGIVKPSDLKVRALAVPGNGLRISGGGAVVLNGYQVNPDQAYAVSNAGEHIVLPADMPAPQGATAYYLVCAVVGDPEFDQTDHPFMPSSILPEDAADYEYVRIVVVPCPAGTTQFEQLGYLYPGYALARLEVPASTSTITQAMITDLRSLSQPRQHRELIVQTAVGGALTSLAYVNWPTNNPTIIVPPWATRVTATAVLSGIVAFGTADVTGGLTARVGDVGGFELGYDIDSPSGATRETFILGVDGSVAHLAGQAVQLTTQGRNWNNAAGNLDTWGGTQIHWDVQFTEAPI